MSSANPVTAGSGGLAAPWAVLVLGLVFALGVVLGRAGIDSIGRGAARAFQAIAGAHYRLYLARENVNADGGAEYAVLLAEQGRQELARFTGQRPGWSVRDALVPGWVVVTVPEGWPQPLQALRAEPFARAVLRNRGMWICH